MLMFQPPFENTLLRGDSVTLAWAPEPSRGQRSPQDARWGQGGEETEGGGSISDRQTDGQTDIHTDTHHRQTHR